MPSRVYRVTTGGLYRGTTYNYARSTTGLVAIDVESITNTVSGLMYFLRSIMMDSPHMNSVLQGYEFSENLLLMSLHLSNEELNKTPPFESYWALDNHPAISIVMHGAMLNAMQFAGILWTRNQIRYNAGGVEVDLTPQAKDYLKWCSLLYKRYDKEKVSYKKAVNMTLGYGNIPSGYSLLSRDIMYNSPEDDSASNTVS